MAGRLLTEGDYGVVAGLVSTMVAFIGLAVLVAYPDPGTAAVLLAYVLASTLYASRVLGVYLGHTAALAARLAISAGDDPLVAPAALHAYARLSQAAKVSWPAMAATLGLIAYPVLGEALASLNTLCEAASRRLAEEGVYVSKPATGSLAPLIVLASLGLATPLAAKRMREPRRCLEAAASLLAAGREKRGLQAPGGAEREAGAGNG